jgi:hypothetical protein
LISNFILVIFQPFFLLDKRERESQDSNIERESCYW